MLTLIIVISLPYSPVFSQECNAKTYMSNLLKSTPLFQHPQGIHISQLFF